MQKIFQRLSMKINNLSKDYRYERKFIVPLHMETIIPSILEGLFPDFSEIYYERIVNSIYFDTGNFDYALNHIEGNPIRKKVRIRYYGSFDEAKKPILEFKKRDGLIGFKKKINLYDFGMDTYSDSIIDLFTSSDMRSQFHNYFINLNPKVFVTYLRSYYLSKCGNFRITFDRSIEYYSLLDTNYLIPHNKNVINEKNCLLELKYSINQDSFVSDISKRLKFRLTNNSKYINAIASHGMICS